MKAPWPGPFGAPPDTASIVACVCAGLLVWQGQRLYAALARPPRWAFLIAVSLGAMALSAAYVTVYLRGGPRIIDATSYWLQARALAEGHLTWPISEPSAAVRGRFLLLTGEADTLRVGVIFPPGYALVLALGFLVGAPLWVGPMLAALLVVLTYTLTLEVSAREDLARLGALFSLLCAALRYHTADTMAHGWAAVLVAGALLFAYRAARGAYHGDATRPPTRWPALDGALTGLALGWLIATRPVSGMVMLPLMAVILWRAPRAARAACATTGLLPLIALVWQQHALTSDLFRSSQAAYYALADGPPGCFRYGFGDGIGCLHEHGAYVSSVLPHGLDAHAVVITTLRRLRLHLIDVANAEPLALLAFGCPWLVRRATGARARALIELALVPLLLIVGYAPFYFDGSYPGAGARFFADALPVEHVLLACALPALATLLERRLPSARVDLARVASGAAAVALAGFGVHAAFEHLTLRDREGGRPFFEPRALHAAGVERGLLLIGTDHGFNLAYDPRARDAARDLVVIRERGDDRDRLIWDQLGRPPAYRYTFDEATGPAVARWWPPYPYDTPRLYRYEAEAEWPPLAQSGGFFEPASARGSCAWGGELLAVHPSATESFQGAIAVPVPFAGRFSIAVHLASRGDVLARFVFKHGAGDAPLASWTFAATTKEFSCATLTEEEAFVSDHARLEVSARPGGELWVDAVALRPIAAGSARQP